MDENQFDALAKGLASPSTRRRALGGFAGGGLLSALGLTRAASAANAATRSSCILTVTATVRVGPDAGKALETGASALGEISGKLTFALSPTGGIDDGTLLLKDGKTKLPVVGQALGRSLNLRIAVGHNAPLILVGMAEQEIKACKGAIDGVAEGPRAGDVGDWHGALSLPPSGSASVAGSPSSNGAATSGGGNGSIGGNSTAGGSSSTDAPTSTPTDTSSSAPTSTPTPLPTIGAPPPCANTGESCASADCCLGFCDQGNLCDCIASGDQCVNTGTGGCCDGNPCNAAGNCGPLPCANTGESCAVASCCVGFCDQGNLCDCISDGEQCVNTGTGGCCDGNPCNGDGNCGSPAPAPCPGGQTNCGGSCFDLSSDARHCGVCGTSCGLGAVCSGGACVSSAPSCLSDQSPCTPGGGTPCCDFLTCEDQGGGFLCQCSPAGDVCGDSRECCSGNCQGDGFCA